MEFIKIMLLCIKGHYQQSEKILYKWEKICANHRSDESSIQNIHTELLHNSKKTNNSITNLEKEIGKALEQMFPQRRYANCLQQLELDMEQKIGSKQEKEYIKAVYYHPAYLTSMQSTL